MCQHFPLLGYPTLETPVKDYPELEFLALVLQELKNPSLDSLYSMYFSISYGIFNSSTKRYSLISPVSFILKFSVTQK